MRSPVLASLLVDIMRTPAGLAGTRPWWCAAVGVAMILTVAGCSSDSDGTAPLPVGFVEGTVELQGEGLLGDQRVRLERDWELLLIDVDGNGSYRSEVRAGEVWSASFLDSHSYVGASEAVAFLVEEGETATLTPLEAKRAVYEWELPYIPSEVSLIYAPVDAIVRFVNLDDEAHELFRRFESQVDGVVDGVVGPGEALEVIFTEPARYRYRCRIHAKSWSLVIQPLDTFRP